LLLLLLFLFLFLFLFLLFLLLLLFSLSRYCMAHIALLTKHWHVEHMSAA